MSVAKFDHVVIAAKTLDEGVMYIERRLGVEMTGGGRHLPMGTHNKLLRLDGTKYLEVISVDPENDKPEWARWFGLDTDYIKEYIDARPRVVTWVACVQSIEDAIAVGGYNHGVIKPMSRGSLSWDFTFTDNGDILEGGAIPPLIKWNTDRHPAASMPESGCSLEFIEVKHPDPVKIISILDKLGLSEHVVLEESVSPSVKVVLRTPNGTVILD